MIKISHENLDAIAREHYEGLKKKIDIPSDILFKLLLAKPKELEKIVNEYKEYEKYDVKFKNKYTNFITKKDEYDGYDLADKLQVNVCPYCNENATYTIITKDKKKITRPEFDHFYDKSTYPVLSLSFYNLIPCCHICNSTIKGIKEFNTSTHIHPYIDSFNNKAKFILKIEKTTFYHSVDGFKLELEFDDKKAKNSAEVFKIKERYDEHKDLILELIQKQEMYPDSYIDELFSNYEGTLFRNREDLLRLITCGYVDDESINKRPLSKLIKDISKELDLL